MYEALSYQCMRPYATSVCGLNLLVYEALSYYQIEPKETFSRHNAAQHLDGCKLPARQCLFKDI